MRLDRFLSENAPYSRSEIKKLVKNKYVTINSEVATSPSRIITLNSDRIYLQGEEVKALTPAYLMLNKPPGYVSARVDATHPVVLDLVTANNFLGHPAAFVTFQQFEWQIVGRLDIDTTGLLLMTSDGQWNHRITSPSHACTKVYVAKLDIAVDNTCIEKFASGIRLHGETRVTQPAMLEKIDGQQARVHIQEGRYHQVKRMFAACGKHVISLHRESIGALTLDKHLSSGQCRLLTAEEVKLF